jgi:hypothetical protein
VNVLFLFQPENADVILERVASNEEEEGDEDETEDYSQGKLRLPQRVLSFVMIQYLCTNAETYVFHV